MDDLEKFFKDKDILVTGGCGSIGSEIVKQLLKYDVRRVRSFDNNESGQFHLQEELGSHAKLRTLIGDIRDKERLKWAMKGVDIVFHAAALKHVPLCEYNPFEAVSTNVQGTQNLIDVTKEEDIDRFIAISTDKAVNPINTMGATKLLSEKLVMNAYMGEVETKFSCVRFGNVLNSNGSVIPVFREQIKKGGPVTVTSKEMIRFFMSMPDAVRLILKAAQIMEGREIFILKMKALRITDLAEVMIEELAPKYGHKQGDIKIKFIGLRPGEKLRESLVTEEEISHIVEKGDMLVVKSGIVTPHYIREESVSRPLSPKKYEVEYEKLLTKDEIRKLLKEKIFLQEFEL